MSLKSRNCHTNGESNGTPRDLQRSKSISWMNRHNWTRSTFSFLSDCSFFPFNNGIPSCCMIGAWRRFIGQRMSPTSHPSTFNTAGATVALLLNLRCPTPMTVISDATKFGRLERRNALWVEDGVLHEGRNMKLGLFLMTKFGLDLFSACYFWSLNSLF